MLTSGTSMSGRYLLSERIATGGMGDVWKAEDTVLGRTVAVKALQPAMLEEPGFAERFRAEARVMATINHPGVVQVYDYGESAVDGGGSVAYLVMEYVEGEPLHQVLHRVGRLTPSRTMDLIAQAADALQAAHDRGIVHRDVKPGNLLVRPNGKLVLTDFGIARSAISGNLTQVGSVLGTASYVSPEQASGSRAITPASDVYSLGVVAYQCLAGRRPFEGDNPIEVAMKHIQEEPPPLPPDVPDNVRTVVARAMAKDVAARWPDAKTMAEAARAAKDGRPLPGAAAMGGTSVLPSAGPTAVIPGAGPGVGPVAPTSPAQGGQFMRGAAAVPVPGQGEEEFYQTSPGYTGFSQQGGFQQQNAGFSQQGGGGFSQGGPPGGHGGGYSQGKAAQQGGASKILGVAAGVIVVVLGIVLAINLWGDDSNPGSGGSDPSTSPSATATGSDERIELKEEDFLGRPYEEVVDELEQMGLNVTAKRGRWQDGFEPGQVIGIEPDGPYEKDDEVTVWYQPRPRAQQPKPKPTPSWSDTWPTDTPPSTSPPTTDPTSTTATPTPTGGPSRGGSMTDGQ